MRHLLLMGCLLLGTALQAQQNTIFHETFDNNFLQWMQGNTPDYAAEVRDGAYRLAYKHEQGAWNFWQSVPIHPDTSYYIESRVIPYLDGKRCVYGLIWGVRDLNNYNAFLISNEGKASVVTCQRGVLHRVMPWLQVGDYQSNQRHTIGIRNNQGRLRFYLDNRFLFKTPILPFHGDLLGFFIAGKTRLDVQELRVYQGRAIDLIDSTFEGYERRNLGAAINSPYAELHPLVAHDGQTLYITRKGHPDNIGADKKDDAWVAYRQNNGDWGPLKPMDAPINNAHHNQVIAVSPDNNTLLLGNRYTSDGRAKGKGVSISYRQDDGSWSVPKDLIIEQFYTYNPIHSIHLAASRRLLLLALERNDTHGHLDLYVSFLLPNGHFSQPKNLGPTINTRYIDGTPFLAADGKTLYFSSAGHGGYGSTDIFVSKRLDDTWQNWSKPKNLGPVVNSSRWEAHYSISAFGDKAYFVSTQGQGHIGAEDVYEIVPPPSARPDPILMVKGKTLDANSKQPLRAHLVYTDSATQSEQGRALSNSNNGAYQVVLPPEPTYEILAYSEGYYPTTVSLIVGPIKAPITRYVNLYLTPIEVGQTIAFDEIHFDEESQALHPEHTQDLDRLQQFLKKYPNMQVELQSTTTDQAKQMRDHLIRQGAPPKHITIGPKPAEQAQFTITGLVPSEEPLVYRGNFSPDLSPNDLQAGAVFRLSQAQFEADSAALSQNTQQELVRVAELLQRYPDLVIEVGGHTNGLPAHDYCDALSTRRAQAVAAYLVQLGLPPQQVQHRGYGKRRPVATDHTLQGRQRNQRVELKVVQSSEAP